MNGVVFRRSAVRLGAITKGLSNTYLVGEKYVAREQYLTGNAENDDQTHVVGFDIDTLRTTALEFLPLLDERGVSNAQAFGSAHPAAFAIATVDGAILRVSYQIDPVVHQRHGTREAH